MTSGKIIGGWAAIAVGRIFMVEESDDPKACFVASHAWNDLGKIESIPIMTSEDVIKLAASKK